MRSSVNSFNPAQGLGFPRRYEPEQMTHARTHTRNPPQEPGVPTLGSLIAHRRRLPVDDVRQTDESAVALGDLGPIIGLSQRSLHAIVLGNLAIVLLIMVAGAALLPSGRYVMIPGHAEPVSRVVQFGDRTGELASTSHIVSFERRPNVSWLELAYRSAQPLATIEPKNAAPLQEVYGDKTIDFVDASLQYAFRAALMKSGQSFDYTGDGLLVTGLLKGLEAREKLEKGDVIVAIDGTNIQTVDDALDVVQNTPVGTKVVVERRNKPEVTITRIADPLLEARGFKKLTTLMLGGLLVDTYKPHIETKGQHPKLSRDVGDGASAGLAFALAAYEDVTGRKLFDGERYVATGRVQEESNSIEAVGGIEQKLRAAQVAGIHIFLMPRGGLDHLKPEMLRRFADMRLIIAITFDEAIDKAERGEFAQITSAGAVVEPTPTPEETQDAS
jgi:PDZ domain-containing protein